MDFQLPSTGKDLATIIAPVRPISGVTPHVQCQVANIKYLMTADPTLAGLVHGMISHVFLQDHLENILVTTNTTAKWLGSHVLPNVIIQGNTNYHTQSTTSPICISKQYISKTLVIDLTRTHFQL